MQNFSFFKTLALIFLALFVLLNIIFAILSISLSLQFDVYKGSVFDGIPGVLIASSFLAVILTFLLKWTKDYKLTGKLITSSEFFKKDRIKKILIGVGVVIILAAAGITIKDEIMYSLFSDPSGAGEQASACYWGDNIALVKIHGGIGNYKIDVADDPNGNYDPDSVSSEEIVAYLEEIEADDKIQGIIVEIDSPGGIGVAGEEIMNPLLESSKPVAAVVREKAWSAGYMIASAADRIFASRMSEVGSIGVTMSYLDNSKKNKAEGITYNQLSTGKFKDTGDPDKELTAEEKDILMASLEKTHQIFVEYVAKNRNMDIKVVEKLADGNSFIAQDAKDLGLIDEIGDISSAKNWLRNQLGIEPAVCIIN